MYKHHQAGYNNEDMLQDLIWFDIFPLPVGLKEELPVVTFIFYSELHTDRVRHVYKDDQVHDVLFLFHFLFLCILWLTITSQAACHITLEIIRKNL